MWIYLTILICTSKNGYDNLKKKKSCLGKKFTFFSSLSKRFPLGKRQETDPPLRGKEASVGTLQAKILCVFHGLCHTKKVLHIFGVEIVMISL